MLDHRDFEELKERRRYIDQIIEHDIWLPDDASEDLRRARAGHHQYRFLLEKLTQSAEQAGLPFREAVLHSADIVRQIQQSVTDPSNEDVRKQLNFWRHLRDASDRIRTKNFPYLNRIEIESAAATYLQAPFRAQQIDRLLVDLLVAIELFAFGEHLSNPWVKAMSPRPVVSYLLGRVLEAVLFGAIIGVAVWMKISGFISETAMLWTTIVCVGLFVILSAVATFALPFAWWAKAKTNNKSRQLLLLMLLLYQDIQSDGAISALHIREKAKKADEQGVAWPATLFAVLDDIAARTGRF